MAVYVNEEGAPAAELRKYGTATVGGRGPAGGVPPVLRDFGGPTL